MYSIDALVVLISGFGQIFIGVFCILLGIVCLIATKPYWVRDTGAGIWTGVWILITGALGVGAAVDPTKNGVVGANLAFNIISAVLAILDGIFFAFGVL